MTLYSSASSHSGARAAYIDPATGREYPLAEPRWRSDDGGPLMITPLPGIGRADIDQSRRSLWRYAASLPVAIDAPITMGEGMTPLVEHAFGRGRAHFKLEWFAPTGSFKDRGASVMLSMLRAQGIATVLEDSSGNGGAAIAAYAAAGGMRAKILVPASTQPAKIVQMRAYGAAVELIPGTRQDTADAAVRPAENIFYASHNWQPFFLHGTKTLAYELWEDLGFRAPDNIIIPCGAGHQRARLRDRLCRTAARRRDRGDAADLRRPAEQLRADSCELHGGRGRCQPVETAPTIAEGTAIAQPIRDPEVLAAMRRSGGATVAVTEEEIVAAPCGSGARRRLRRADLPRPPPRCRTCCATARSGRRRRRWSC